MVTQIPQISLHSNSTYHEIVREINKAVSYVTDNQEDDRIEFVAYGIQIRIRRTKINCHIRINVEWKSSWENNYHEIPTDKLVEFLYSRRGA